MNQHRARRLAALAVGLAVATSLTSCGNPPPPPPETAPVNGLPDGCPHSSDKSLTLVLGARMGSPRPQLTDPVRALVEAAVRHSQKIQVVLVDGQPTVALAAEEHVEANNTTLQDKRVNTAIKQITDSIGKLGPKKPEADVLGALSEAGRVTPAGGTVVLMDSGISTAGGLSYLDKGMFGANPAETASYLAARRLLPQLDGRSVLLVGVGGTADPQPALNDDFRDRVVKMWQEVATKAGAVCTKELTTASRRDASPAQVPVTVVPLPVEGPVQCGVTVLQDSDSVGFVPDTANLREPAAANHTLQQLATLMAGGTQRATLAGNTASVGPVAGLIDLSKRRAETIKTELVRLGVAAERITTRGDGNTGKYHTIDLDSAGNLIPAPAAANRSVVVDLVCSK